MPESAEQVVDEEVTVEETVPGIPQLIMLDGAEDAPVCENGVCL